MRDLLLGESGLVCHYAEADVDHNRMVTAFSGHPRAVLRALRSLCEIALPAIDLRQHMGVHPRIGALDVCPFVVLGSSMSLESAVRFSQAFGRELARTWDVPVYLYEKSERVKHSRELPALRLGGYEGLAGRELEPDCGPMERHEAWGATVLGVRDWLLAANLNLSDPDPAVAKAIARSIREARDRGDAAFAGVRALGLPLPSKGRSQVSLNLTRPDETSFDSIVEHVEARARALGVEVVGAELVGVIRPQDLERARRLPVRPEQVVEP